jgi:predicted ATP-grasp superfamily ATP-dependent carboligase
MKDARILIALPDLGNVGPATLDYIRSQLNAKLRAAREIPAAPAVILNKGEMFDIPRERIYDLPQQKLSIRIFDAQPTNDAEIYKLGKKLAKELEREAKEIIVLSAIRGVSEKEQNLYALSNNPKIFDGTDIKTQDVNKKVGVIGGLAGMIYYYFQNSKIPCSIILIESGEKPEQIKNGIDKTIRALASYLKVTIDTSGIDKLFAPISIAQEKKYIG